jgi:4-amino-4-deoxy-L-arabinose transferase-like glycosyltransferase
VNDEGPSGVIEKLPSSESPQQPAPSPIEVVLFLAILLTASTLRLVGIDHHLARGSPDFDERNNFVDPVLEMWRLGSPNPTVYSGYPGFFNYLIFFPVGLGNRLGGEVGAYTAARLVVALFGILSVVLLYVLARRLWGPPAALFGAALLAFSRGEVRASHNITPDVLVGTATLAVLLVILGGRGSLSEDRWAGALGGLATAVKYTGLLLTAALLGGLFVGRRLRARLIPVLLAGGLTFVFAAPYAVLRLSGQGSGLAHSLDAYYGTETQGNRFAHGEGSSLGTVAGMFWTNLGPAGCLLAAVPLFSSRLRRTLLPAFGVVVLSILAMMPANRVFPRHVLVPCAAATVLAAAGFSVLLQSVGHSRRRLFLGLALGIASLIVPVGSAVGLAARYQKPFAVDQAAAWIEKEIPGPSLVLTSLPGLRLDPGRFEVRNGQPLARVPEPALRQYDLIVATQEDAGVRALEGLVRVARFSSSDGIELI